jgi:hypothetical protein
LLLRVSFTVFLSAQEALVVVVTGLTIPDRVMPRADAFQYPF